MFIKIGEQNFAGFRKYKLQKIIWGKILLEDFRSEFQEIRTTDSDHPTSSKSGVFKRRAWPIASSIHCTGGIRIYIRDDDARRYRTEYNQDRRGTEPTSRGHGCFYKAHTRPAYETYNTLLPRSRHPPLSTIFPSARSSSIDLPRSRRRRASRFSRMPTSIEDRGHKCRKLAATRIRESVHCAPL